MMDRIFVVAQAGVCSKGNGTNYGKAMAMERLANLNDEVTEGRSSVRVEDERVERRGWTVSN